jgi:peptide/nickel transport system substrate-binding protein
MPLARGPAAAGWAAALAVLAACRAQPAPGPAADTLTLAVRADVAGFYPQGRFNESYTLNVNANLVEGLVRLDSQLRIAPGLAWRWETPDERTYLFELRHGVRFSDGRPLTADDVVASLQAVRRGRSGLQDYLDAVETVRALGPDKVEIRTRGPYRILLGKLPFAPVVPAPLVEAQAAPGTGPYRLERWDRGREFTLVRNPMYRGTPAPFARARFLVAPDDRRRIEMVANGSADLADEVPPELLGAYSGRRDMRVVARPGLRVLLLAMRVDRPPFSDPRLREALDLALDRAELIRDALAERAEPAAQPVPRSVLGFNPEIAAGSPDRARARRLLAEAGFPRGLELRLDGPFNRYVNDRQILAEIASQLGEVGVRITVNAEDKGAFFERIYRGDSALFLVGRSCETGDGGDTLERSFHTRAGLLGSANTTGLSDAELDRLIERAWLADTEQERVDALRRAMARAVASRSQLPLLVQTEAVAISTRIDWDPPLNFALRLEDMRPAGAVAR